MAKSKLEEALANQLTLAGIPFEREVKAVEGRKFKWDFQIGRLLVEVQGGIWGRGGHTTGVGVSRDCEKGALATLAYCDHFAVTAEQIKDGRALGWIQKYLSLGGNHGI
jgi:hypothetical protein